MSESCVSQFIGNVHPYILLRHSVFQIAKECIRDLQMGSGRLARAQAAVSVSCAGRMQHLRTWMPLTSWRTWHPLGPAQVVAVRLFFFNTCACTTTHVRACFSSRLHCQLVKQREKNGSSVDTTGGSDSASLVSEDELSPPEQEQHKNRRAHATKGSGARPALSQRRGE
jgi:hypothetical protein